MLNDYGLANIAWQRQRDAERAAAAHRLVLLAERGARAAVATEKRESFAAWLIRWTAGLGAMVKDLGRLPQYAAEAERLHREIRRAATTRPATRWADVHAARDQAAGGPASA